MKSSSENIYGKITRYFALLVGVAFVLAGVGGFLPYITQPPPADALPLTLDVSYGFLLGLFPVNILHNLFHFTVGVLGLRAYSRYSTARIFARNLSVVLGVLTVMGLIPIVNTTFGILPLFGHAIWLHGIEALAGFYLGFYIKPVLESPA